MTEAGLSRLLNDGIFNDAPDVVPDSNGDGAIDEKDPAGSPVQGNVRIYRDIVKLIESPKDRILVIWSRSARESSIAWRSSGGFLTGR